MTTTMDNTACGDPAPADKRAQFEAWYDSVPEKEHMRSILTGHREVCWKAWQARVAITQQAAPAAPNERQAHVLPPTRGTDSQHDAIASVLTPARIDEIYTCLPAEADTSEVLAFAYAIEAEVREQLRLAGAAKGGNTNTGNANFRASQAATTPSASGATLTTGQILALERRSNMTDDEAIRHARSVESLLLRAPSREAAPQAWTKERITKLAKAMAEEVAKNAGTVPQLTFPHIYLGLTEALAPFSQPPAGKED